MPWVEKYRPRKVGFLVSESLQLLNTPCLSKELAEPAVGHWNAKHRD